MLRQRRGRLLLHASWACLSLAGLLPLDQARPVDEDVGFLVCAVCKASPQLLSCAAPFVSPQAACNHAQQVLTAGPQQAAA